jgi:hypothetical protein
MDMLGRELIEAKISGRNLAIGAGGFHVFAIPLKLWKTGAAMAKTLAA